MIQILVRHGADINARDSVGESVLHVATRINSGIFDLLIQLGADIHAKDANGETALHAAIRGHKCSMVQTCILHGADLNLISDNRDTVLNFAIRMCAGSQSVEMLLRSGADVHAKDAFGKTALHTALECKSISMVKICIRYGADVNAETRDGDRVLHSAIRLTSNVNFVELLLQSGADVNARDARGMSVFDAAAAADENKADSLIWTCMLHGAHVNGRNKMRAVRLAVLRGDFKMTKSNLAQEGDINAIGTNGQTLLHLVVACGTIEMITLVLEHGANVNSCDDQGATPLHLIARRDMAKRQEVEILLQHGTDIEARDNYGRTALYVALTSQNGEVVQLLLTCGANANARDNKGSTPLHAIAGDVADLWRKAGLEQRISLLLRHGAQLEAPNRKGRTALHLAIMSRNLRVVESLLSHGAARLIQTEGDQSIAESRISRDRDIKQMLGYFANVSMNPRIDAEKALEVGERRAGREKATACIEWNWLVRDLRRHLSKHNADRKPWPGSLESNDELDTTVFQGRPQILSLESSPNLDTERKSRSRERGLSDHQSDTPMTSRCAPRDPAFRFPVSNSLNFNLSQLIEVPGRIWSDSTHWSD